MAKKKKGAKSSTFNEWPKLNSSELLDSACQVAYVPGSEFRTFLDNLYNQLKASNKKSGREVKFKFFKAIAAKALVDKKFRDKILNDTLLHDRGRFLNLFDVLTRSLKDSYKFKDILGVGSHAFVLEVKVGNQDRALKVAWPAEKDPKPFRKEVKNFRQLHGDRSAELVDDRRLLMDCYKGRTLDQQLDQLGDDSVKKLALAKSFVAKVEALHDEGLVHGDLFSENVAVMSVQSASGGADEFKSESGSDSKEVEIELIDAERLSKAGFFEPKRRYQVGGREDHYAPECVEDKGRHDPIHFALDVYAVQYFLRTRLDVDLYFTRSLVAKMDCAWERPALSEIKKALDKDVRLHEKMFRDSELKRAFVRLKGAGLVDVYGDDCMFDSAFRSRLAELPAGASTRAVNNAFRAFVSVEDLNPYVTKFRLICANKNWNAGGFDLYNGENQAAVTDLMRSGFLRHAQVGIRGDAQSVINLLKGESCEKKTVLRHVLSLQDRLNEKQLQNSIEQVLRSDNFVKAMLPHVESLQQVSERLTTKKEEHFLFSSKRRHYELKYKSFMLHQKAFSVDVLKTLLAFSGKKFETKKVAKNNLKKFKTDLYNHEVRFRKMASKHMTDSKLWYLLRVGLSTLLFTICTLVVGQVVQTVRTGTFWRGKHTKTADTVRDGNRELLDIARKASQEVSTQNPMGAR